MVAIDAMRTHPSRAVLFALVATTPFACGDNNCPPPPKAEVVPGAYEITSAYDDPDLLGGTITLTSDTLTVTFERSTGAVEVVYEIGEGIY